MKQYLAAIDATRLNKDAPEILNDWGSGKLRDLADDKTRKCGIPISGATQDGH
jgi:hypothetical protein